MNDPRYIPVWKVVDALRLNDVFSKKLPSDHELAEYLRTLKVVQK